MPHRRQPTVKGTLSRSTARIFPLAPKTIELEQRIARLESRFEILEGIVDLLTKRSTALQAQIDHVGARSSGR